MKKKSIGLLILCMILLSACSGSITGYSGNREKQNGQEYVISDNGKEAFASVYTWDGDENNTRIVIPDEINGATIVEIGGFTGTGVPNLFAVTCDPSFPDNFTGPSDPESYGNETESKEITFTVVLGKNIRDVHDFGSVSNLGIRQEDGTICFYLPVFRFAVDPENRTYYAEDGKLKLRKDGSLEESVKDLYVRVDTYSYVTTLAEKLEGTWREGDDVYEIFSDFGKLFINAGNYYEGSLYAFYGYYGQPEDPSVLQDRNVDHLKVMCTWFSDFSPGTVDPSYAELKVSGDTLTMTMEDGTVHVLKKDRSAPKQFPIDVREIAGLLMSSDEPAVLYPSHPVVAKTLENDDLKINVYLDGVVSLYRYNSETIQVYRGSLIPVQDNEYVYSLTKLGGGTMPYFGRFKAEKDENTLRLTNISGDMPLFQEGETEAVLSFAE
ncbi:MAG: hypothetical protein IIZ47_00230 [Erysipelotrichaceae bacterium]|nr:hypothetical protein [Erysipelotrichaceae bacterium]